MLIRKVFKDCSSEFFALTAIVPAFFWFTYCLLKGLAVRVLAIENLELLIWIIACIVQSLTSTKKIRYSFTDVNLEYEAKQEAKKEEKPGFLITLIVLGLPLIPLIVVLCLNVDTLTASYIVEPEFNKFSNYSNIFAGLLLISMNLQDLITVEKKVWQRIIAFSTITFGLIGMAMLLIYTSHMTEMVS